MEALEGACKQNGTKQLAKLLPGAEAVGPAMPMVIAQLRYELKLILL